LSFLLSDKNIPDFRSCCCELTLVIDDGSTAVVVDIIGRFFTITGEDASTGLVLEV
jgi:hypothetical protein